MIRDLAVMIVKDETMRLTLLLIGWVAILTYVVPWAFS